MEKCALSVLDMFKSLWIIPSIDGWLQSLRADMVTCKTTKNNSNRYTDIYIFLNCTYLITIWTFVYIPATNGNQEKGLCTLYNENNLTKAYTSLQIKLIWTCKGGLNCFFKITK